MKQTNKRSKRIAERAGKPARRQRVLYTKSVGHRTIGAELRTLRVSQHRTLQEIALALGCGVASVCRWEHNQGEPAYSVALEWMRVLGHPDYVALCAARPSVPRDSKTEYGKVTFK